MPKIMAGKNKMSSIDTKFVTHGIHEMNGEIFESID